MARIPVRGEILDLVVDVLRNTHNINDEEFIKYLNYFFDFGIEESSLKSFEALKQTKELEGRLKNGTTEQRQ